MLKVSKRFIEWTKRFDDQNLFIIPQKTTLLELITITIILCPHTPWYTDDLRTAKQEKRRTERQMRKTKLT